MKCEHCGYEAPERAVICPECGEILPRPKKQEGQEGEKSSSIPDNFSMPFLASEGSQDAESAAEEDPHVVKTRQKERKSKLRRRIVALSIAGVMVVLIVLYTIFLGGYKLAAWKYIKGVDYSSGSIYVSLVPDAFMDYLETNYETTRREVKSMVSDYFVSWNETYGNAGRMTYKITSHDKEADLDALEEELNTSYGISVEITKAVTAYFDVDDGGSAQKEKATFVKIGTKWCCMEAMDQIDYVCQYDGYEQW